MPGSVLKGMRNGKFSQRAPNLRDELGNFSGYNKMTQDNKWSTVLDKERDRVNWVYILIQRKLQPCCPVLPP